MNVWLFNHYAVTPEFPGGTRHFDLGKQLSENGHHVAVFAAAALHQNPQQNIINDEFKVERISDRFAFIWLSVPTYHSSNLGRLRNMLGFAIKSQRVGAKLIKQTVLAKPDVIVGSTVHPFTPLAAQKLAKKLGARYCFEIRDLWPQTFVDMGLWSENGFQARFFRWIEKISLRDAAAVICLSPQTEPYLKEHYAIVPGVCAYIPNGIDLSQAQNGTTGVDLVEESDETHFFNIVFTGAIIPSNQIDTICQAAAKLGAAQKIRLHLVGNGTAKTELQQKYAHVKSLVWHDPVPKKCVASLLKKADALLLIQANINWGSSNKLYDYLAAGKPVISSIHAPHNDIVRQIKAGISIQPDDADSLAGAFLKIVTLPEKERTQMAMNAFEYVRQNHDWKLLGQRYLNALEKTMNRPSTD